MIQEGASLTVSTSKSSNAAVISYANGTLSIHISTGSAVEAGVVITAEIALAVLAALVPFVALPAWLIILLPILRADIPLAQLLFDSLAGTAQKLQKQGASPQTVMAVLQEQISHPDNNPEAPWA